MASIFTYEPDPPRVASPWLQDPYSGEDPENSRDIKPVEGSPTSTNGSRAHIGDNGENRVTRLQAEPQEGPVEYKLHLLLRPRRKFRSTSTGSHISGSKHSGPGRVEQIRSASESVVQSVSISGTITPPLASIQQTRQHRLEQLTTQLLWRLQQSSPHHTSSSTNIILPSLPEALPELQAPHQPVKLLHGLEESHGALYEIGVSDDGTFVGLAEDEMQESLNNLRAMAGCLGCTVEILRKQQVGDCEWLEDAMSGRKERKVRRTGKLFVAEALVKPCLRPESPQPHDEDTTKKTENTIYTAGKDLLPSTEQLRLTLTGPTMSGKSTLLGTLTTSTLDNGRGQSRLSMLKHRHEISSGVTSSVTQELLGYHDGSGGSVNVVNYATDNVASWIDIHVAAAGGRLCFISDSAGHPRYRRTTVRGLVGWSPHWTLLCVPADDTEDTAGKYGSTQGLQHSLGSAVADIDLSGAQLDLCLRLKLSLVVVITKLDLASRTGLKNSLTKVLDALKAAGRKPAILTNRPGVISEDALQTISALGIESAYHTALPLLNNPVEVVPIVLTSAVQGTGMNNLHALLHELPLPGRPSESAESSGFTFHIEDVYIKPTEVEGVIVSGLLRSGRISVGDCGTLGPFSTHDFEDSEDSEERPARRSPAHLSTSRSFPGALRGTHLILPHFQLPNQEWRRFKVTSIRNIRLPVHSLLADQVGSIAIAPDDTSKKLVPVAAFGRIRKGMILTAVQPRATRSLGAEFKREDLQSLAVGNHVVVYIASVRASARITSARAPDPPSVLQEDSSNESTSGGTDPFNFDDIRVQMDNMQTGRDDPTGVQVTTPTLIVTFSFDASKEFVMVGDQVLVMPGGGPGLYGGHERGEKGVAGLEGFVGKIVEVYG